MRNISVVGFGKVGRPLVSAIKKAGFNVAAIDTIPIDGATTDFDAILGTEITFVIVPTPSLPDGNFSNEFIYQVAGEINKRFAGKEHLVALNSTVTPETMETFQALCGCDCCYNPFFIRQGTVEEDILNPDFILIGEKEERAGKKLEEFYKELLPNEKPIIRMNYVNAELTKICLNTFLTMKMSFANSIGDLCEMVRGADSDVIFGALQEYHAIGKGNLKASVRYGGPCLPRDNKALLAFSSKYKTELPLAKDTDKINDKRTEKLVGLIRGKLPRKGRVLILGTTYKTGTELTEESQGLKLKAELDRRKIYATCYDPFVNKFFRYGDFGDADIIIICTPHKQFKSVDSAEIKESAIIIDCWGIWKDKGLKNYIQIGKNI
jgi:UDPglucose 6-dehydrogenase